MTNCHCSNSCCHLPRRLWWLVHLHCSYVDATFFTPFCFSSPASQLFLIQDSNCQKNSYFCCHLPLEKALLATPIHTPTTLQLQSHQRSKLLLCLGCQLFLLLAATSTFQLLTQQQKLLLPTNNHPVMTTDLYTSYSLATTSSSTTEIWQLKLKLELELETAMATAMLMQLSCPAQDQQHPAIPDPAG